MALARSGGPAVRAAPAFAWSKEMPGPGASWGSRAIGSPRPLSINACRIHSRTDRLLIACDCDPRTPVGPVSYRRLAKPVGELIWGVHEPAVFASLDAACRD